MATSPLLSPSLARMTGRSVLQAAHHALLVDTAGEKLSKRDFANPVRKLLQSWITAAQALGVAVFVAGIMPWAMELSMAEIPDLMSSIPAVNTAISMLKTMDPM